MLEAGDDPSGWFSQISSDWFVGSKLQLGRILDDGAIVSTSASVFNPGDFVDVTTTFDVVTNRVGGGVTKRNVHLAISHVVLLKSAEPGVTSVRQDSVNSIVF